MTIGFLSSLNTQISLCMWADADVPNNESKHVISSPYVYYAESFSYIIYLFRVSVLGFAEKSTRLQTGLHRETGSWIELNRIEALLVPLEIFILTDMCDFTKFNKNSVMENIERLKYFLVTVYQKILRNIKYIS